MTGWLVDTMLWTAVLIALVLLVRRPVARWFGPQMAYALWALPMIRLLLPPLQLPGWLAPEPSAPSPVKGETTLTFLIPHPATNVATQEAVAGPASGLGSAAPDEAASWTLQSLFETGPLIELALLAWLTGAAIFMYLRFAAYFRLRRDLLADAREVGRAGRVRLIETPATAAPLAFGVIDKVVALPPGFMAQRDRNARDLALAHELEHHDGRDLLINVAVQPLFALHWWNPLGRYGWLALRRDQEAACDARVMAHKPVEDRALYASVIAGFAAGPEFALAAPMACPVLGEKSIIQRLRSLKMTDKSPRRRFAGRALLGAAMLALPLTASISYAESEAVPEVPEAPEPPAPPTGPDAPTPPTPPAPPEILTIDPDAETQVIESKDGRTIIIKRERDGGDDARQTKRIETIKIINRDGKMNEVEIKALEEGVRTALAEADEQLKELPTIMRNMRNAMVNIDLNHGEGGRTILKMECRDDDGDVAKVEEGEDGRSTVYLCHSRVMAQALEGLKKSREDIARDLEMSEEMRQRMLKQFDEMIANWKKQEG